MKAINCCVIFMIVLMGVLTSTCDNDVQGECHLAGFESSHEFPKEGGQYTFKAKRSELWTFDRLFINGLSVWWDSPKIRLVYEGGSELWHIVKIEGDWFVIEKLDEKQITVTVDKTDSFRTLSFNVYQGNCWETIYVEQAKNLIKE